MTTETKPRKARKPRMYRKLIDMGPTLSNHITAHKLVRGYSYETESFREILAEGLKAMREQEIAEPNSKPSDVLKKRYANTANRRVLSLPEPLASELRAYRAESKIANESAVVRALVEQGLAAIAARDQHQHQHQHT
jgi:hypothetical protein